MKRFFFILGAVILVAGLVCGGFYWYRANKYQKEQAPQSVSIVSVQRPSTQSDLPSGRSYPPVLNLTVPFFSQAPKGDWSYPYQEACEEASVLLVANVYNRMNLTGVTFEKELLATIEWEKQTLGFYEDTTVEETAAFALKRYGLKTKIHTEPTFETIESILNDGHLIVAPFAGRMLPNPFFKNGGPKYHMLVIKGYDAVKQKIITNDVGTSRGENFMYAWRDIYRSLHDWNGGRVESGDKKIIEIWKD